MRILALSAVLLCAATMAYGQSAPPDLKGTWTGKGRSVVFGHNPHHPGAQSMDSPPRIRDYEFTFAVEGQDGRLAWGRNSSSVAQTREPFAWAITADGKNVVGADTDGSYFMTLQSADLMELCYTHNGQSPSKSIIASCTMVTRKR